MGRPLYPIGVKVSDDEFAGVQCRPDNFFYQMLFDLKVGELSGTQFVIIDKEYHAPPAELKLDHSCRRVRPNDDAGATDFPPLIPKYSGK